MELFLYQCYALDVDQYVKLAVTSNISTLVKVKTKGIFTDNCK